MDVVRLLQGMCFTLLLMSSTIFASETNQRTVLITGANRGLGLEFARQFNAKGYHVIGTARKPQQAKKLEALGVQVEQLDVTDASSVSHLAKQLKNQPIDILVNNAGILVRDRNLNDLKIKDLERTLQVNTIGPMRMVKALMPNLKAGHEKRIVNISSRLGSIEENTSVGYYSYRASKAALNQLNRSLSNELQRKGFITIAIHPGWVRTDMGGHFATYSTKSSIKRILRVLEGLTPQDSGRFFDLNGKPLPW